jgi:acylglycerol lipase
MIGLDAQIDPWMTERAIAAIARCCAAGDGDDLDWLVALAGMAGGVGGIGDAGLVHEHLTGEFSSPMIWRAAMIEQRPRAILGLIVVLILGFLGLLLLGSCAVRYPAPRAKPGYPIVTNGYFAFSPQVRLPYRDWRPAGLPRVVVLALHGFDDSRDAWVTVGPRLARHGVLLIAPDQRGFGAAPGRGFWPGTATLLSEVRQMIAILHQRYPHARLTLMGESMGAAETLMIGASGDRAVSSYVLISPAVWGGRAMAPLIRWAAALGGAVAPGVRLTGRQAHILASDNIAALIRLSHDPLTILQTRLASVAGIVRLMGRAQAACGRFAPAHALVMYSGHDQLIPKSAMARCWKAMPMDPGVVLADYPPDYHLMVLDHQRAVPIGDILSFVLDPNRPIPSSAPTEALIFMAEH